jgi:hypothetical protein
MTLARSPCCPGLDCSGKPAVSSLCRDPLGPSVGYRVQRGRESLKQLPDLAQGLPGTAPGVMRIKHLALVIASWLLSVTCLPFCRECAALDPVATFIAEADSRLPAASPISTKGKPAPGPWLTL